MTVSRVERGGLKIAQELDDLVKNAIAPGTGIDVDAFWSGFETTPIVAKHELLTFLISPDESLRIA